MNHMLEADIRDYVASDVAYPKRYKIRPRVYFIIIKTEAATMQDFKESVLYALKLLQKLQPLQFFVLMKNAMVGMKVL